MNYFNILDTIFDELRQFFVKESESITEVDPLIKLSNLYYGFEIGKRYLVVYYLEGIISHIHWMGNFVSNCPSISQNDGYKIFNYSMYWDFHQNYYYKISNIKHMYRDELTKPNYKPIEKIVVYELEINFNSNIFISILNNVIDNCKKNNIVPPLNKKIMITDMNIGKIDLYYTSIKHIIPDEKKFENITLNSRCFRYCYNVNNLNNLDNSDNLDNRQGILNTNNKY
jgi:hypothetical protein